MRAQPPILPHRPQSLACRGCLSKPVPIPILTLHLWMAPSWYLLQSRFVIQSSNNSSKRNKFHRESSLRKYLEWM